MLGRPASDSYGFLHSEPVKTTDTSRSLFLHRVFPSKKYELVFYSDVESLQSINLINCLFVLVIGVMRRFFYPPVLGESIAGGKRENKDTHIPLIDLREKKISSKEGNELSDW